MSQISAELIVRTALTLLDTEGAEEFSMRRLGRELGVDAKAIYYYFPGKEALIDAVLRLAFAQITLPDAGNDSWQARLRALTKAYHGLASAHPSLIPYLVRIDSGVPAVFVMVEQIIATLKPTGLGARSIVQIIDLFWSFLPSFAIATGPATGERGALHQRMAALLSSEFPAARAVLSQVTPADLEEDVDLQIDILIWGIEALITRENTGGH